MALLLQIVFSFTSAYLITGFVIGVRSWRIIEQSYTNITEQLNILIKRRKNSGFISPKDAVIFESLRVAHKDLHKLMKRKTAKSDVIAVHMTKWPKVLLDESRAKKWG